LTTLEVNAKTISARKNCSLPSWRSLFISTCICEVLYLLLILLSPLPGFHLASTPLVSTLPVTLFLERELVTLTGDTLIDYSWISFTILGSLLISLFLTYGVALLNVSRLQHDANVHRRYLYVVLGGATLFGITLLFQPMLLSDNVFSHIFSGRILAVYHTNPLSVAPQQFANDPYLSWLIFGRTSPNISGPLWLNICGLLASLSDIPLISLFLFKGLELGAHLLNILLIWTILGRIAPHRRIIGTLLYAWSPLVLIELAASGHNEGVLVTLLLMATFCFVRLLDKRSASSHHQPSQTSSHWQKLDKPWFWRLCLLITLGLAIGINLVTLLIAPLYIWFELRQRPISQAIVDWSWRFALLFTFEVILMSPFWRGADTFFRITSSIDMAHFVHSPVALFTLPLRALFHIVFYFISQGVPSTILPDAAADMTIRATATFLFILIYCSLFGKIRRSPRTPAGMRHRPNADQQMLLPGFDVLLTSCSLAVLWYLILVSGWFWPWYILWFFWLVALRRIDTLTITVSLLSCTALFIYAFTGFIRDPLMTYQAAIIFGIPLTYLLIDTSKQSYRERIHTSNVRRSQTTQD
jgi:hypothetical protein